MSDVAMFVNGRLMAPEHDHVSAVLPLSLSPSLPPYPQWLHVQTCALHALSFPEAALPVCEE